jgi:hypothetical protein
MTRRSKSVYKDMPKYWIKKNLVFRFRLCHYSVGGAWWHLGFYESFQYPVRVISLATEVESEEANMNEWVSEIG